MILLHFHFFILTEFIKLVELLNYLEKYRYSDESLQLRFNLHIILFMFHK